VFSSQPETLKVPFACAATAASRCTVQINV